MEPQKVTIKITNNGTGEQPSAMEVEEILEKALSRVKSKQTDILPLPDDHIEQYKYQADRIFNAVITAMSQELLQALTNWKFFMTVLIYYVKNQIKYF